MSEKRRRRTIFGALTADPWRKLLAIALAVAAWFFVNSRINASFTRVVPLTVLGSKDAAGIAQDRVAVVLPTDRVVGMGFHDGEKSITHVELRVSGPRFKVEAWQDRRLDLQITSLLETDWAGRENAEFTAADLPRELKVLEGLNVTMNPPRIRLKVVSYGERRVPLTTNTVEIVPGELAGRLRMETLEFTPDTAIVSGSAAGLDHLLRTQGKRFRVVLTASSDERQATGRLELLDVGNLKLELEERPVATVKVVPQTSRFELALPILVDDLSMPPEERGRWLPESPTRTVRIAAGGELRTRLVNLRDGGDSARVAAWAADNLRLLVHVPPREPGAGRTTEVDRLARLSLVGRLFEIVDRSEAFLDEPVLVKLRLQP